VAVRFSVSFRLWRSIFAVALTCGACATAVPADAQSAAKGRLLSFEETRLCVCLENEIAALRAKQGASLEAEYKRVDDLVAKARPSVDVYDRAEVESFERLYARREELRQQLQAQRSATGGLIAQYNASCADQRMLKVNVDAVRANPAQCPQQP
jgi:hypothetical protein